jgi:secreted PhoX family phosphatase
MARPLEALAALLATGRRATSDGYGPLAPVRDETTGETLLQLPRGFRYLSTGWTGDRLDDGTRTPGAHDGMAAFSREDGHVVLVRNHEVTGSRAFASGAAYDSGAGGGTTTLTFDPGRGAWGRGRASLAGTVRNCAGGPTPWGSWLTCEESLAGPAGGQPFRKPHGFVFEVPAVGEASAEPLTAMGRFVHEAVAVDPETGIVYLTEDQHTAGLYRFLPATPGRLADGGRLEMLAIAGRPQADTARRQRPQAEYPVRWVAIDDPTGRLRGRSVYAQGRARGGARFARLEGAAYGGGKIYVTATSGGDADMGQVWELDPVRQRLRLVFESPGAPVLNMPDNLCVSPRGALVICEDGTSNPCVHGLTTDGRLVRFARNNVWLDGATNGVRGDFRSSEFAGATFSADGAWLFLNVQRPGFTVAITGPWGDGRL